MLWCESILIVRAQLERVSWAAMCIWCDLLVAVTSQSLMTVDGEEIPAEGTREKMMLESLPESRKSGNG